MNKTPMIALVVPEALRFLAIWFAAIALTGLVFGAGWFVGHRSAWWEMRERSSNDRRLQRLLAEIEARKREEKER